MSFIERVGKKRVGFWCWKLFIINYFKSYEVNNIDLSSLTLITLFFNAVLLFTDNHFNTTTFLKSIHKVHQLILKIQYLLHFHYSHC